MITVTPLDKYYACTNILKELLTLQEICVYFRKDDPEYLAQVFNNCSKVVYYVDKYRDLVLKHLEGPIEESGDIRKDDRE